ncbi:MAG: autotransporter domain-containing protein [Desulfobaccales bacterium]
MTPDLVFSTYLGGSAGFSPLTFGQNAACDALGNIYVTGATQVSNLPVLNAYQSTPAPGSTESAFVAKYNPAGQLLWCTYLGGNNQSMGIGVAATPTGGVAVTGITTSDGSGSFPTTSNAFQSKNNGQSDYFVTVFDAQGKLQYSTYLGGSGAEGMVQGTSGQIIFTDDSNNGNCVAVDANGRVYVGGITTSGGGSGAIKFPVTDKTALQKDFAGSRDASLSILDPAKSGAASLVYSSFLGGDHDNQGHSVAVDPSGRNIAVGGFTTSSNFPTTSNAYRSTAPSGGFAPNSSNGFITQFQSSKPGSPSSTYTMRYSTYLGADSSTARDDVYGMTMTPSGLIVATGRTQSSGFPMTTAGSTVFNSAPYLKEGKSGDEPYVVKIDPSLNGTASLVYSTFLGGGSASGKWGSWSTSVAVDARGAVYAGGETDAQGALYDPSDKTAPQTFPYTRNAFLQALQGSEDAMLMQINPSGDPLDYSTYLGGTLSDRTYGLAVDPDGNVVVTGLTFSSNFPVQNPAQTWPGNANYQNAFVTKFSPFYSPSNLIVDSASPVTGDLTYDNEYIGQNSTGTLTQGGFTNTVNNNLRLGQNAGASGTYDLSGGSLSVGGNAYIGYSGTGTFTQTGGTHTVTGILMLAADAGSSGTYSLSSGSLSVGNYEAVGYSGTGTFTQSGGTHSVTALYLGIAAGASGSYTLSDGSLSVGGDEYIGYSGTGSFTQSGGTHTVDSNFFFGAWGGTGSYDLSDGSLSAGTMTLNSGSTFTQTGGTLDFTEFNQSDGTSTFTDLYLGRNAGSSSTFNLGGGNVTAAKEYVGHSGTGTFTQSGGTNTVSGNLILAANADSSGTYNLQGGGLTAGTIIVNSGGLFNQTGGTLDAPITLAGGIVAAGTDNGLGNQTLTINSGTLQAATGTTPTLGNPISVGGDFILGGADNLTLSGAVGLGGATRTLTVTNSGNTTLSGIISNGGLNINNTGGTLNLSGVNTYTGGTTLAGGTLLTGNNSAFGSGAIALNGGTIGASAANITVDNLLTIGGSFNMGGAAGTTLEFRKTMNLTGFLLTHNGASDDTLKGNLTSTASGGITVTAGTLNLTGDTGGYSGTSTVTGGTLNLQCAGSYAGNNSVSGGILNLNSASVITYSGINTVTGGTLNMSSAGSTYSGASTLSGGTLNLSAGTLSGLLTLNGGAFNLSGTASYTNAAPLTNSADTTLNIASGSTLTLTGGLTNNGNTDVNGNLTGNLTNNAGGLVNGSGVITGTLMNNGRVNPGNSPGTLSVVGSYVQTASGTYTAEIASGSSYDRLNVTGAPGTATLAGAIAPTLYGGFKPRGNQVFPGVLTASGGISGTFSTILNQQFTPTLFWQTRYNPNSLDLWVQRNYTNASLSLNSNQLAVGTMLNSVAGVTSGDLDNVLNAIDYLPNSASVQNAFKQISPEKAGSLTNLGFVAANFQMRNLATRTTNQRFVQGEGGNSVTGGGLSFNYSKMDGMMLAFSGASLSNLFSARKEFQAPESRWGLYLDGGAAFGSQNSSINQTGYNFNLGGMTLGADYRLQDSLLVGLATGYSNTSARFNGSGGSVNTNTVPFNAYAAYFPGSLYAYGSLGYALNLYDLNRGISFNGISRSATSSTTGNQLNLYGETGYDLRLSHFILTPSATLAYSGLWVGSFTETGAGGLNLKVGTQNANSMQTGLGGRLTVPLRLGSVKVVPQGYAFYQHEFANGSRNLNASLSQGSSSSSFQTDAAKRNFALAGVSVTAGLRKNLYAQVNFNAEVGRTGSTAQFINAGLRYEF